MRWISSQIKGNTGPYEGDFCGKNGCNKGAVRACRRGFLQHLKEDEPQQETPQTGILKE